MRQLEDHLRTGWIQEFLKDIRPHAHHYPNSLYQTQGDNRELIDIVAATNWNTIRTHVTSHRAILKALPGIHPFKDEGLRAMLNHTREHNLKPTVPKRWLQAASWICRTMGAPDYTKDPRIHTKLHTIREHLTDHLATSTSKAHAPPLSVLEALEHAATTHDNTYERHAASCFRWILGASARYADAQHTNLSTYLHTPDTLELTAWKTKPRDIIASRATPTPLICPKESPNGVPWWDAFQNFITSTSHDPRLKDRDYLLPTPGPAFRSWLPLPCPNNKALRILRTLLHHEGLDPSITTKITLPSLRLFLPNLAYAMNVPRTERQIIGRWAHESTADTYTRDHREVITKLWRQCLPRAADLATEVSPLLPIDLNDPHYTQEDAEEPPPKRPTKPSTTTGPLPMDEATHLPGYPFTIVLPIAKTQRPLKFHITNSDGLCVGHKYTPKPSAYRDVQSADDWRSVHDQFPHCHYCFKTLTPPSSWTAPPAAPPPTTSSEEDTTDTSSGDLSDMA